jgi:hypothetical protein
MSVSPQDFALWSQMTGRPYPQSPAERMALAPEVYSYTRSIGRQGGPTMGPVRRTVDVIGKAALAAGALAGAGYLVSKYGGENPPPPGGNPPPPTGFGALALDTEPGVYAPEARYTPDVTSVVARTSGDITPQPTSDNYNQDVVNNQTALVQDLKGLSSQKPTQVSSETKPATQSAVITTSQSFRPGAEEDQLIGSAVEKANAFRQSKMYETMQRAYPGLRDTDAEMLGEEETEEAPTASVLPTVVVRPETRSVETQPKVADLLGAQLQEAAQSDARLYRSAGQHIGEMKQKVNELQGMQPAPARGPSQDEIRDLDSTLIRSHGNLNRIQREDLRNQLLSKKYGEQSAPDYVSAGETVSTGMQVGAPKEFLHSKVQEVKQRANLSKYGYDPEQGFGEKQAPAMEQVGGSHTDLVAEQLQREIARKSGRQAIYDAMPSYPSKPPAHLADAGAGIFFKPASYVMS